MRVGLCDDHVLLSEALAVLLARRGHEVAWQVTEPEAAVARMAEEPVDVVLLDLCFPAGSSVPVIPELLDAGPRARVVVLSGSDDMALVGAAVAAGATGVVSKSEDTERILSVAERVSAGEAVVHERALLAAVGAARRERPTAEQHLATFLTDREREVLRRLVRGQETARLAKEMGIRYSTARTHIQSILTKLGVHSKLEAVAFALEHQVVTAGAGGPVWAGNA